VIAIAQKERTRSIQTHLHSTAIAIGRRLDLAPAPTIKASAERLPVHYRADKIDYNQDHCRSFTYDIIKARSDPTTPDNSYTTAKQVIQDLTDI